MSEQGFEPRYVITNEHAPEECEAAFKEWMRLQKEHPDLAIVRDAIVCGCPNGDHRGSLVFTNGEDARTALKYEQVGRAELTTWVKVPYGA